LSFLKKYNKVSHRVRTPATVFLLEMIQNSLAGLYSMFPKCSSNAFSLIIWPRVSRPHCSRPGALSIGPGAAPVLPHNWGNALSSNMG